jgi:hypothetical protein
MSSQRIKPRAFRYSSRKASNSVFAGQGFKSQSFAGEQKMVNKEWDKTRRYYTLCSIQLSHRLQVKRTGDNCQKVLSPRAVEEIVASLKAGTYDQRKDALEPPFMAPSPIPGEYSKVRFTSSQIYAGNADDDTVVLRLQRLCSDAHSLCDLQGRDMLHHPRVAGWMFGMDRRHRQGRFRLQVSVLPVEQVNPLQGA